MPMPMPAELVRHWVSGPPIRLLATVAFDPIPQGATARGCFLGQNNSDPAARGTDIFLNPQNMPTAIAMLLTHAQNRANFHPASANPADLLDGFLRYLMEMRQCPAFTEILNDQVPGNFDSGDYNRLVNQISQTYVGVSRRDQLELAQSMADMYRSVMSSEHGEVWANLFTQTTMDYSNPQNTLIYLYFTTLHMRHDVVHSGKDEHVENEQSYWIRRAIFQVNQAGLRENAQTYAQIAYANVDDWLGLSTTPERQTAPPLCFTVQLLD